MSYLNKFSYNSFNSEETDKIKSRVDTNSNQRSKTKSITSHYDSSEETDKTKSRVDTNSNQRSKTKSITSHYDSSEETDKIKSRVDTTSFSYSEDTFIMPEKIGENYYKSRKLDFSDFKFFSISYDDFSSDFSNYTNTDNDGKYITNSKTKNSSKTSESYEESTESSIKKSERSNLITDSSYISYPKSGYCKISYGSYGKFLGIYESNIYQGVSVKFKLFEEGIKGHLYISPYIGNKLSAITINKNEYRHGKFLAGPILFWLGTSSEWEQGIKQLTPNTNFPCCSNKICNLLSPTDTPYINDLIGKTTSFNYKFKVSKCDYSCKTLQDFVQNWLVIYGKKFKTIKDTKVSCYRCTNNYNKKIGVDAIGSKQLSEILFHPLYN